MNITDFLPFIGNNKTNLWAKADKAIVDWENAHLFTVPSSLVGASASIINPIAGAVVARSGINAKKKSSPSNKKATTLLRNKGSKTKSRAIHSSKTVRTSGGRRKSSLGGNGASKGHKLSPYSYFEGSTVFNDTQGSLPLGKAHYSKSGKQTIKAF